MQANEIQKQVILGFWKRFGGWKPRLDVWAYPRADKMDALKEMSLVVVPYCRQQSIRKRREGFNGSKVNLCRQKVGSECFVCGSPGFNRHHIIQLQNGGINSRRNLIILCDRCHSEIHPWLKPLTQSTQV